MILAIILSLTFAAYGDDADPGGGGNGDLQKWTAVEDSTFGWYHNYDSAIAYGNNRFVAVVTGGFESRIAYSSDGVTWTAVSDSTLGYNLRAIAYGNGRFVAVGRQMACCDW